MTLDDELDDVLGAGRAESGASCRISSPRARRRPPDRRRSAESGCSSSSAGRSDGSAVSEQVVLVVEDLHWADGSTRDLLRFLVRTAAGERLALIATVPHGRPRSRASAAPVSRRAAPRRACPARRPGAFSRAEFADHVAAILGTLPAPASLDRLYERSEGNPFFTEELLERAGLRCSSPNSLRDAMAVQLERLPPAAERVVRVSRPPGATSTTACSARGGDPGRRAVPPRCRASARPVAVIVPAERERRRHARLARLLWDGGRGSDALPVSARAVALTPPDRTPERARVLESHARMLLLTGRTHEAQAPIDEAIAIARALGAGDVEAAALATRVIAMHGRADAAITAGREALRAAHHDGRPDTVMRAYINAAEAFDHGGRVQDAIDLATEGIEESRRLAAST